MAGTPELRRCEAHCTTRAVGAIPEAGGIAMQTTIIIDDALWARAKACTGLAESSAVIHEALYALIARESARRLAVMGGTEPTVKHPPRRRAKPR